MQLKFNPQQSFKQTIFQKLLKLILILAILVVGVFFIEKINFPYPKENIQKNITDEITKLK